MNVDITDGNMNRIISITTSMRFEVGDEIYVEEGDRNFVVTAKTFMITPSGEMYLHVEARELKS